MRAERLPTAKSQSNTQRRQTSTQKKLQDANKQFVRSQEIQIDFVRSASLDEFEQQLMKLEINGDISFQCNDVPDNDEIPAEDLHGPLKMISSSRYPILFAMSYSMPETTSAYAPRAFAVLQI